MKTHVQQVLVSFGLILVASCVCAQQEDVRAKAETRKQVQVEAREKPLRDADALIKKGKPADAYALLDSLKLERFGEVRVNYLLGIAALESGKPDKAALAFERVLTVDKNYPGVRLDMARAYYQTGDLPRAKTEFQAVMAQNPSESIKLAIQTFLDAINEQEGAKRVGADGDNKGVPGRDSKAGSLKKSRAVAKEPANQDAARAIQAQREAEVRAIAEQQARQYAETRAKAELEARQRQAEIEARAKAELEARQRAEAEAKSQAEMRRAPRSNWKRANAPKPKPKNRLKLKRVPRPSRKRANALKLKPKNRPKRKT